jgi:hypothetical protein
VVAFSLPPSPLGGFGAGSLSLPLFLSHLYKSLLVDATNHKRFWIRLALINLSVVALVGSLLRSKMLFSMPFMNQKHLINAHSHFAFGGWATLSLFTLFIYKLLPAELQARKVYQFALWGIALCSWGMMLTFPFLGYSLIPIVLSTLFIFVTYLFSAVFIRDLYRSPLSLPVRLLALSAVLCLVVSSAGPFTLAYVLATGSANAILYRDAIYTYLHFQYNGFFTLGVFALLLQSLHHKNQFPANRSLHWFAVFLCSSVVPSLFLSLLWHPDISVIRVIAIIGIILIILSLFYFFRGIRFGTGRRVYTHSLPTLFWHFAMLSFVIKMLLQMGTIIPGLGDTVFGFRPIIIGFLHLVFLGFFTFYILSSYFEDGLFNRASLFDKGALSFFAFGIVMQEVILLTQGIMLFAGSAPHIFYWLLWIIAIMLFVGATLVAIAALRHTPGPKGEFREATSHKLKALGRFRQQPPSLPGNPS